MTSEFYLKLSEKLGLIHSAYVESDKGRQPSPATFYIDTGSPVSMLSPELCRRLQLPLKKLDFNREEIGIGGALIDAALIDPVKLTFSNEDTGEYETVELPIFATKYTRKKPQDVADNILGMTFFANTPSSLYVENDMDVEGSIKAVLEIES